MEGPSEEVAEAGTMTAVERYLVGYMDRKWGFCGQMGHLDGASWCTRTRWAKGPVSVRCDYNFSHGGHESSATIV